MHAARQRCNRQTVQTATQLCEIKLYSYLYSLYAEFLLEPGTSNPPLVLRARAQVSLSALQLHATLEIETANSGRIYLSVPSPL